MTINVGFVGYGNFAPGILLSLSKTPSVLRTRASDLLGSPTLASTFLPSTTTPPAANQPQARSIPGSC